MIERQIGFIHFGVVRIINAATTKLQQCYLFRRLWLEYGHHNLNFATMAYLLYKY